MKNRIILTLVFVVSVISVKAQLYTPEGKIKGTSGNNYVGIGNVTPLRALHISREENIQLRLERPGSGISDIGSANGDLYFWPGGDKNPVGNILMPGTGNLGIGTYTPQRALHVSKENMVQLRLERPNSGIADIGSANGNLYFWPGGYVKRSGNVIFATFGNIGIGTDNPAYKLDVAGTIRACEIKVELSSDCTADFVFEEDYNLRPLNEVEDFIKENKHLPEIASADEMVENGISLNEMNAKLLQKIEELTLYVIEMQKRIEKLEQCN